MKNINYLMDMTKDFIDGKIDMFDYGLNFPFDFDERYQRATREHREYIQLIYEELLENGIFVAATKKLDEKAYRKLIKSRYNFIKSIAKDGFY